MIVGAGAVEDVSELLIEFDYLTHRGPGLEPIEATIDILKR